MLSVQVRLSAVCNEACADTNSRNGKQKLAFIAEENSSLDVTLKEHTWCLPGGGISRTCEAGMFETSVDMPFFLWCTM